MCLSVELPPSCPRERAEGAGHYLFSVWRQPGQRSLKDDPSISNRKLGSAGVRSRSLQGRECRKRGRGREAGRQLPRLA
eukprot:353778-Chlamydomonas_euryale.AAC.1